MDNLIFAKKHFSKIGWCYAGATLVIFGVQLLIGLVLRGIHPGALEDINGKLIVSAISMYVTGFPLLAFLLRRYVPAKKIERKKLGIGRCLVAAVMCIGLAYMSNLIGNILTMIIGAAKGSPVTNEMLELTSKLNPLLILAYMVIAAPILEELFFRKMLVERTVQYGEWVAVLTSGLMFGLFHGNLNQFIYATTIGMFLAYLYVKTGDIRITISLHMLFNFIGGFLSTLLMNSLNLDEYLEAASSADLETISAVVSKNPLPWIGYMALMLFVGCMMLASFVLFIIMAALRRIRFERGEIDIPREIRYSIIYANKGMILFGLFWLVMMIIQLLA